MQPVVRTHRPEVADRLVRDGAAGNHRVPQGGAPGEQVARIEIEVLLGVGVEAPVGTEEQRNDRRRSEHDDIDERDPTCRCRGRGGHCWRRCLRRWSRSASSQSAPNIAAVEASQVNFEACFSAPLPRALRARGVGEQRHDRVGQLGHVGDEQPAASVVDRVEVTGDARRDDRRAAGGRLGERETEALALGCTGDDPRSLVPLDEFVVGDASDEAQPIRRTERCGLRLEALALRTVTDDDCLGIGDTLAYVGERGQQVVDALLRHHARDGEHERSGPSFAPGREPRVDAVVRDGDSLRIDAVVLDDLVARRVGHGYEGAVAGRRSAPRGARRTRLRDRAGRATACPTFRDARGGRDRSAVCATTAARRRARRGRSR